jgi:hypothetical protein
MPYTLLPAKAEETALFFRSEGETAERRGAIGYMRADFGRSGRQFYSHKHKQGDGHNERRS